MNPAILVPRRADGGRRDRLWEYAHAWWERETDLPIAEGYDDGPGPFCLSAAINRAAADAGAWDVAVVAGADVIPGSATQVDAAARAALERGQLVLAHDHYYSLSEAGTDAILAGEPPHGRLAEWPAWTNTFSTLFVVPRALWDAVGGWDERFVGWGFEDFAFWSACWAYGGGFDRVTGPVFHLWHERRAEERGESPNYSANEALGRRYMAARTSAAATARILAEPGGPLA